MLPKTNQIAIDVMLQYKRRSRLHIQFSTRPLFIHFIVYR